MKHKNLSKSAAYDKARQEFYQHRHLEDIKRRIAKEEALHTGAYFGKGPLEIGMELENKMWESWKQWAGKQIEDEQQMRSQMMSQPESEGSQSFSQPEFEEALQEVQPSVPQSRLGQPAVGGAAVHP